jgi:hypothetical protein
MRPDTARAIREHLIAAMEQRSADLDGEARRVLDARLAELRATHSDTPDNASDANAATTPRSPLGELVEQLAHESPAERAAYPELPALAEFRQRWSTLRADSQLRQSVTPTSTDAGPLNSAALASRAIALMRELSPGYLRAFLAYVDDLAWLEQLGSAAPATGGAGATKKRGPRKPRS